MKAWKNSKLWKILGLCLLFVLVFLAGLGAGRLWPLDRIEDKFPQWIPVSEEQGARPMPLELRYLGGRLDGEFQGEALLRLEVEVLNPGEQGVSYNPSYVL